LERERPREFQLVRKRRRKKEEKKKRKKG